MEWLSGIPIHVVADREFVSPKLAEWLKNTCGVGATLRMEAMHKYWKINAFELE